MNGTFFLRGTADAPHLYITSVAYIYQDETVHTM
jgi:hypothetical protein